jgi:LPS export ABC transporter protein LptC/lipopolysaccharide transport protein LptA
MTWQRRARLVIVLVAVACLVAVAVALRPRPAARAETPVSRTDPNAVVESAGGHTFRVNREHEEIRIEYQKLLSYANGSSRLIGVKVTTERAGGRTFTITGNEGEVGDKESNVTVSGNVLVRASDGLEVRADRAVYTESDGRVRAAGPVRFARGRMSGTGNGCTYDKNQNVLTLADGAIIDFTPDASGAGGMHLEADSLEYQRNEKVIRFDRALKATRGGERVEADAAVAHLSADEQRLERLELRGNSRITPSNPAPGAPQFLGGRDIDVKYASDGQAIEHARIAGDALLRLAGQNGQPSRDITAATIDIGMAADGATPVALEARDNVRLILPADAQTAARTITARTLDSSGAAPRGLTSARFAGNVLFAEQGSGVDRTARSSVLDVAVANGFGTIDEARFGQGVRFVDGDMTATALNARYVPASGALDLAGTDPSSAAPRVVNPQITVEASRISIILAGPIVKAAGRVKSVLQPRSGATPSAAARDSAARTRIPSMLKQDQPVNVTADEMTYDGGVTQATYRGNAQLWQGETTIKAAAIAIDSKSGNLDADGPVTTTAVLLRQARDGSKERVASTGQAKTFKYEDEARRATYLGDAHLSGPQGDTTAPRIELYLTDEGDRHTPHLPKRRRKLRRDRHAGLRGR